MSITLLRVALSVAAACILCWAQSPQLNQYQQYLLQLMNNANGRNILTSAFSMTGGIRNLNESQYIEFRTVEIRYNTELFPEFGAMRATIPGLYLFFFTVTGNSTGGATVDLFRDDTFIIRAISRNGQPEARMALVVMNIGESAYLEIRQGAIVPDNNNDANNLNLTNDNYFSGVLIAATTATQGNFNPIFQAGKK